MTKKRVSITLAPATITKALALAAGLLIAANVAVQVLRYHLGYMEGFVFIRKFDLNGEDNFPAYFSGLMLLLAAALLGLIAKASTGRRYRRHWLALAGIFAYLCADELLRVHEFVGGVTARLFGLEGAARHYAWVVSFGLLALAVAASYVRFLLALRPRYRALFLAAGGLYVGGALGMELAAARHVAAFGEDTFTHAMLYSVEEAMEMAGVIVFIYALLHYAGGLLQSVHVRFDAPSSRPRAEQRPARRAGRPSAPELSASR